MRSLPPHFAPYAPAQNVLDAISRHRRAPLDVYRTDTMAAAGMSHGNIPRTLQTLRFLGLIDDAGCPTAAFEALRADDGTYRRRLAEVVGRAYHAVLAQPDAASLSEAELQTAFGRYEPRAQVTRMVALFRALCQESAICAANYGSGRALRHTNAAVIVPIVARAGTVDGTNLQGSAQDGTVLPPTTAVSGEHSYALLQMLLHELPATRSWRSAERSRWLAALTALLDLLVTCDDSPAG